MSNVVNQVAFLRTSRNFPEDLHQLTVEMDRSYIDIASSVNSRTIGIFPTTRSAQNGESWFLNNSQRQQGFRQVYTFTGAGSIPHGLKISQLGPFVRVYGAFTDGATPPNEHWYPLPYVDATDATNQVQVVITDTSIVITAGGGSPPTISSGVVVVEWLSLA